ncbi:MAG: GTPase Era [Flavobacteriales bacterium TMED123]|nr:MAG: GTPase Era [Flavobacteriales bacterium TMED123]|tara:strand:+ start:3194 stop:4072 length:879 start_codon:yes stop_codon:yes gene_type:complete
MEHKAGFVNIIGNPNVGKSTLMNALIGEKISIITRKAQTTRHRILGILNEENYQIVFSDTPGIIKPVYRLQESMMNFVQSAFQDADVLIYMVEVGEKELKDDALFEKLKNTKVPILLLLNKIDLTQQEKVAEQIDHWKAKVPNAEILPISALNKFNLEKILERILELLPIAPPYYEKDAITDKPKRFFVAESIREKILKHYKQEVPYSVQVEVEEFEDDEEIIKIRAIIYVMRESQKGIIIGHKGAGIKRIGTEARKELERFFDKKIFLETPIKVKKNWRDDKRQLKSFGYE